MFRCGITGKTTAPGEPATKVIIETRPTQYTFERYDVLTDTYTQHTATGWEIVKEVNASPEGIKILKLAEEKPH